MRTLKRQTGLVAGLLIVGLVSPLASGGGSTWSGGSTCSAASERGGDDIIETAVAAGSFKTLAAALQAADLIDALKGEGPFTVFAPTDEAFDKLPHGTVKKLLKPKNKGLLTQILTYHVVSGKLPASQVVTRTSALSLNGQRIDITVDEDVKVDDARVVKTDIMCSNGVIHVIDRVILPSTDNILEVAGKAGSFETLAAAVKAADLVDVLTGEGPFTVFAPTDAAFAKLPARTLENLLKPENRHQLADILKYHVVPGRIYASDALSAETARTAEGSRVRFGLAGGGLMINQSNIVQADIEASNGVIHVIDEVIIPQ